MALVFTSLAAALASTANATSYAGTAGTPASGDLLVCFVFATDMSTVTPTMTGTWTWKLLINQGVATTTHSLYVFTALATAATSTTPTFDCTGDTASGCIIHCIRVTGNAGGGTNNPPYIRQMAQSGAAQFTFGQAPLTGNGCLAVVANNVNSAAQWTAPPSWTELSETAFNTPASCMEVAGRVSGETLTTIVWTNSGASGVTSAIGLEFYVAGAGPTEEVSPVGSTGGFFGLGGTP